MLTPSTFLTLFRKIWEVPLSFFHIHFILQWRLLGDEMRQRCSLRQCPTPLTFSALWEAAMLSSAITHALAPMF